MNKLVVGLLAVGGALAAPRVVQELSSPAPSTPAIAEAIKKIRSDAGVVFVPSDNPPEPLQPERTADVSPEEFRTLCRTIALSVRDRFHMAYADKVHAAKTQKEREEILVEFVASIGDQIIAADPRFKADTIAFQEKWKKLPPDEQFEALIMYINTYLNAGGLQLEYMGTRSGTMLLLREMPVY